ncbi:hypothetical protein CDD81_3953 [Ophiocordyceps australis]|uniref:Uncharacterized protein n=1 Tax=Ophiocordyceps australis TaxID=1399860 RepID=A0A2C5XDW0_9HYPO|nr:hypothetical protein CDD81_3953 [Ophiocordyceps australis]
MLRAGHRFRSGILRRQDLLDLVSGAAEAKHAAMLVGLAEDIGGQLLAKIREKGAARTLAEDRDMIMQCMRDSDPEHWDRFVESQQKARANIQLAGKQGYESAVVD